MLASLLHVSHPHTHNNHNHNHNSPHSSCSSSQTQTKDAVDVQITTIPSSQPPDAAVTAPTAMSTTPTTTLAMETFLAEVRSLFEAPLKLQTLHNMSSKLQLEFRDKLQESNISMLPSFHHTLPTGQEVGTILALDVGGSTFRIALIELSGREGSVGDDGMVIKQLKQIPIDQSVRQLRGTLFFDWMAARIGEVLEADNHESENKASGPLPMSLAWSFPIDQTSTRTGSLLAMGKGFAVGQDCEGKEIGELVTTACRERRLNVELQGIVNDASATLLSQAYRDSSTRISLIMGTGINSAVYLPISSVQRERFGRRQDSWWNEANHVLVNTELSTFGHSVWDSTRWDRDLNQKHPIPDFQPLEYKAGGRFLGELVRLVIVEGVAKGILFQGRMPRGLETPYNLDTGVVGVFERDTTPHLTAAALAFTTTHPLPASAVPSEADLQFIRSVSQVVTSRAAAYVATAVHALWSLQRTDASICTSCKKKNCKPWSNNVTIACNGSIMEKYPGFKERCQRWLDCLVNLTGQERRRNAVDGERGQKTGYVGIEMAVESSVFGAAVAAVAEG